MFWHRLETIKHSKNRGRYGPIFAVLFSTIILLGSPSATFIEAADSENGKLDESISKTNILPNIASEFNIEANAVFEPAPAEWDIFGISKIYPTSENGREFFSNWDNGEKRVLTFNARDSVDSELILKGKNPKLTIHGNGVATLEGNDPKLIANPRIYIYDEQKQKTWNNVEITFYQKRINEHTPLSYSGLNVGARSEHQDFSDENLSHSETYYGRFTNDGRVQFVKEIEHGSAYVNSSEEKYPWNTPGGNLPVDAWIGLKYTVRTVESSGDIKFELYMDTSNGLQGGSWNKVNEFTEDGNWGGPKVFSEPGTSIFIKNDGLGIAQYKNLSVREITPIT